MRVENVKHAKVELIFFIESHDQRTLCVHITDQITQGAIPFVLCCNLLGYAHESR